MTQPSYAEDRAAIEDLMARYLFALDFLDFETYQNTFTEDGVLDWARGEEHGRHAIGEVARTMAANMVSYFGRETKIRHFVTQTVIRVDGDRAWCRAAWFEAYDNGPDGAPNMGTFGHYEDELARIDGQWLYKRRRIVNEFLKGREAGPDNPVVKMDALP